MDRFHINSLKFVLVFILFFPEHPSSSITTINIVSRFSGAKNLVMHYFEGSKFQVMVIGYNGKIVGKNHIMVIKLNKNTYNVKTDARKVKHIL